MDYDPDKDYNASQGTLIPNGEYNLSITGIEMSPTKEGKGTNWKISLLVVDGSQGGSSIDAIVNVVKKDGAPNDAGNMTKFAILKLTKWGERRVPTDTEFLNWVRGKIFTQHVGQENVPGKYNPVTGKTGEPRTYNRVNWNSGYTPQSKNPQQPTASAQAQPTNGAPSDPF